MRRTTILALLPGLALLCFEVACGGTSGASSGGNQPPPPYVAVTVSPTMDQLSRERQLVYGDFVEAMSKTNFKFLSSRTFPLDLSGLQKDAPCLRGLQLEDTEESAKTLHSLGAEVLRGHSIRLVDTQEEPAILKELDAYVAAHGADTMVDASGMSKDPGVLALSEIRFDESHRFAVLKSVFLCGTHCSSATILVLEKSGSRWTAIRRPCSGVVNPKNPRQ